MLISVHPTAKADAAPNTLASGFEVQEINTLKALSYWTGNFVWSPCVWRGGIRKKSNFISSSFCALDFDDGFLSLRQAMRLWCDTWHIVATTKSHQKEKHGGDAWDRYRFVIPWDSEITDLATYEASMKHAAKANDAKADRSALDGARFFYPSKRVDNVFGTGDYTQEVKVPRRYEERKVEVGEKPTKGKFAPWTQRFFDRGAVPGERNKTLFIVAIDLWRCGYNHEQIMELSYGRIRQSDKGQFTREEAARVIANARLYAAQNAKDSRGAGEGDGASWNT